MRVRTKSEAKAAAEVAAAASTAVAAAASAVAAMGKTSSESYLAHCRRVEPGRRRNHLSKVKISVGDLLHIYAAIRLAWS